MSKHRKKTTRRKRRPEPPVRECVTCSGTGCRPEDLYQPNPDLSAPLRDCPDCHGEGEHQL